MFYFPSNSYILEIRNYVEKETVNIILYQCMHEHLQFPKTYLSMSNSIFYSYDFLLEYIFIIYTLFLIFSKNMKFRNAE